MQKIAVFRFKISENPHYFYLQKMNVLPESVFPPRDASGRETTLHGSSAFPFALHRLVPAGMPLGTVTWHWHEEVQICFGISGTVSVRAGGTDFLLHEGELLYIAGKIPHRAVSAGSKPEKDCYHCFNFLPKLIAGFPGSLVSGRYVLPNTGTGSPAVLFLSKEETGSLKKVLAALDREEKEQTRGWELTAVSAMLLIWKTLLPFFAAAEKKTPAATARQNSAVRRMMDVMDRGFRENLTAAELASAANLSESESTRVFQKITGMTPFAYLRAKRMEAAAALVTESTLPVARIAEDCGFGTSSRFIEAFRKQFGITPLQKRKKTAS